MLRKIGRVIIHLLMVMVLLLTVVVNAAAAIGGPILDGYLGTYKVDTDEETLQNYLDRGEKLALQTEEEGIVLVQNQNDTLPLLEDTTKVNVFGWASTAWIGSGSGSAQIGSVKTDFLQALENYGIDYNTELTDMYENFLADRTYANALGAYNEQLCRLYEPSVSDTEYYTPEMLANAEAYSDTAIVVLGRYCGESSDCPKTQYKVTKTSEGAYEESDVITDDTRTYLDVSVEEEELLRYCGEHFENVIVVANLTNAMTLGFLETIPGIDSCLLVGTTGGNAADAIPEVLYGDVNPSGKTTDTYAYDLASSAAYANAGAEGEGMYTNTEEENLYPADGETTNGNVGDNPLYDGLYYVDYAEGIYIGYKWYETADAEGYWDGVDNEYGTGYDGVVQYPFGYGLSYTEFEQDIVNTMPAAGSELTSDGQIEVTVRVTNVGDTAGKDVVQLYYTAPYTPGGIEKSSVELCGFEKTDLLQPGESQELTITFDVEDMASYDCYDANGNDFTGYELDPGEYRVSLMRNAHEPAGEDTSVSYTISSGITYSTDSVTGAVVDNKFTGEDAIDGISIDGSDTDADIQYMTRADFAGTFPAQRAADRALTDNAKALNLYTEEMAEEWIDDSDEDIVTGEDSGLKLYDKNGFTDLAYTLGADYDAEEWDALLNQMTVEEMEKLVLHGYSKTYNVDSIGKIQTKELDGPAQFGGFTAGLMSLLGREEATGFPNETVIAQTWNKELAYEFGKIEGAQAGEMGYEGWYAPSMNMHRTPLGGRNYEYYSEDSYLSGCMAAETVEGSLDAGTYCYMKHLIAYDQDTMRDSLYTWMTEQALRETYLKPFKIAIQEGGATGIMTSYNRLGAVWAGGSEALITGVVREEFGFNGSIITDYSDHQIFMNMDQALRAGADLWMDGMINNGTFRCETESNSFRQALRTASKNIIYTWVNAGYENKAYNETADEPIIRPVEQKVMSIITKIQIIYDVVAVVLILIWIRSIVKRHKKKKAVKIEVQ